MTYNVVNRAKVILVPHRSVPKALLDAGMILNEDGSAGIDSAYGFRLHRPRMQSSSAID